MHFNDYDREVNQYLLIHKHLLQSKTLLGILLDPTKKIVTRPSLYLYTHSYQICQSLICHSVKSMSTNAHNICLSISHCQINHYQHIIQYSLFSFFLHAYHAALDHHSTFCPSSFISSVFVFIIISFIATYLIMSLSKSSFCLQPYLHSVVMSITSALWSSSYCPQQHHLHVCLCHYVLILSSISFSLVHDHAVINLPLLLLQHHHPKIITSSTSYLNPTQR